MRGEKEERVKGEDERRVVEDKADERKGDRGKCSKIKSTRQSRGKRAGRSTRLA
jgi:hypothetical protein